MLPAYVISAPGQRYITSVRCSASHKAMVYANAYLGYHILHTGIAVWMHKAREAIASSQTLKRGVVQPVTLSVGKRTHRCIACMAHTENSHRHLGALALICCLGVFGALRAPRHQHIAWCSPFSLLGSKGGCRCMEWLAQIAHRHRRVDALGPRGLSDSLHISTYLVHCQNPVTKSSHGAACSVSQEARGHVDA